jgi:recombination protein RecA
MKKVPPRKSGAMQTTAPITDLSKLAATIRKRFGAGSMQIPGQETGFMLQDASAWIPCGVLNPILGHPGNGIPCGYYIEIAGPESTGKTTLADYLIGIAQKAGCVAILADIEHSYDKEWAAKQGVDNDSLIRLVSAYREGKKFVVEDVDKQFAKWEYVTREAARLYKRPIIVVVDSLAALLPRQLLEGDYGDETPAALARAMAKNMPKFQSMMMETNTAVVFINQLRDKIGVMFGDKEITPGGRAKNFYFASRTYVSSMGKIKEGVLIKGIKSRIRNKKNKLATPFLELEVEIRSEKGLVI